MSGLSAKKVTVRRFGLDSLEGYVDPRHYLCDAGIEMTTLDARTSVVPYNDIRAVYFVRGFGGNPEREQRMEFASRPKQAGLWVRLLFADGGYMEGIIPNDVMLMGKPGLTITPPNSNIHSRRVFVPATALERVVVMGLIGRPPYAPRQRPKLPSKGARQPPLFPSSARGTSR